MMDKHNTLDHIEQVTCKYLAKSAIQTRLQRAVVGSQKIFCSQTVLEQPLNQPPTPVRPQLNPPSHIFPWRSIFSQRILLPNT